MRLLLMLLFCSPLLAPPAWGQTGRSTEPVPLGHVLYSELSPMSLGVRMFSGDDDVAGVLGESYGLYYEHRLPAALRLRIGGVFYNKTPFLEGYHLRFASPSLGLAAPLGAWNARLLFSRRIYGRRTLTVFADVLHADIKGSYECFFGCPEGREEGTFTGPRTMVSVGLIAHTVFTGGTVVMNSTLGVLVTNADGRNVAAAPRLALGFGLNRPPR